MACISDETLHFGLLKSADTELDGGTSKAELDTFCIMIRLHACEGSEWRVVT